MKTKLHLFEAFGIELEYMIVDRESLNILPVADQLISELAGELCDDFEMGPVTISNELVLHVIELKCSRPVGDLQQFEIDLMVAIRRINKVLKKTFNARLMPTAAHPWMNPELETRLWPHGNSAVYLRYNRIFNCSGHGWGNLQSTHINLPFCGDEEFERLHSATRYLLPIMPALTASSPFLDAMHTGMHDTRLKYYQSNQERLPVISGAVIPEAITSEADYEERIYKPISEAIAPYNDDHILNPIWVNSRGIIARFDRGSIELRILDIQECPRMDLAIASLIIHSIRWLMEHKKDVIFKSKSIDNQILVDVFQKTIRHGSEAEIEEDAYLSDLGIPEGTSDVMNIWTHLWKQCRAYYPDAMHHWNQDIEFLMKEGSLSGRMLKVANGIYTHANLKLIYQELSQNLSENKAFKPWWEHI